MSLHRQPVAAQHNRLSPFFLATNQYGWTKLADRNEP